jgi:hypothetical protein
MTALNSHVECSARLELPLRQKYLRHDSARHLDLAHLMHLSRKRRRKTGAETPFWHPAASK